jgi:hypothetical protein
VANRLVFGAYLLLSLGLISSCGSTEQSILITARAAGTNPTVIETVVVRVVPLTSTAAPVSSDSNPVHRTIQDINGDQPIRIAVTLHDAAPVMVHITAITASGSTLLYATRCYMPAGVLRDEVLLVPLDVADDADGDGWPPAAHIDATCRDPNGADPMGVACDVGLCPATDAADCNDMPSATMPVNCTMPMFQNTGPCVYPGAPAVCGDGVDQDCRANGLPGGSRDEPCGDMDGDGVNACGPAGGVCDCNDNDDHIHPGAMDVCGNGVDEDCSGEPGGLGAFCDADHDTYPSNVDCNDMDPNIHPGGLALEHCDGTSGGMCGAACAMVGGACMCDGVDNNCNGLTDEDASCRSPDLDGDGADACAAGVTDCAGCDCNDCDSGIHPGAHSVCGNTIDEDGIGGDPMCAAGDTDGDGYTGGQDCGEGDPHVHLDAAENCTTPASESCGTMSCPASIDADHDGFAAASAGGTDCNDAEPAVNPWAMEICNGVDDNCNGDADEVLDAANTHGCVTDPTCSTSGSRCRVDFTNTLHHCGGCRHECNPGTTLVADACMAGTCACTTNGNVPCAVGDTCCVNDSTGMPVRFPGCFDTETALHNCGGCGNVCDTTTADMCVGGRCVCGATGNACTAGQTCCGGACVNLGTDPLHCGRCTTACGARTVCNAGVCGCDDATAHGDCTGVGGPGADIGMPGGNGCETDLLTDANYCGTCGQSCVDEHVQTGSCIAGACTITSCQPTYADCNMSGGNGCETSLRTTTTCGTCTTNCNGIVANAAATCSATGTCDYTGACIGATSDCDSNRGNGCEPYAVGHCGGACTNCASTIANATGMLCTGAGVCDYASCSPGSSDCDFNRANGCEPFAVTHCGGACTNCSSTVANAGGATCSAGTCDYTGACAAGTSDCDTIRANGCEPFAASHCGAGCTNCGTTVQHANTIGCSGTGTCTYATCMGGFLDCDGSMADGCEQGQDTNHCGASCINCSTAIANASGATCGGGSMCNYTSCAAGFADCNGNRADGCEHGSDVTHCGGSCIDCSVTTAHATGQACTAGACDYGTCSAGFFDCNPSRADGCEQPQNATHCGGCMTDCTALVQHATGIICGGGATCDYGACAAGFVDCDGNRANGCERAADQNHCGATCIDCEALTQVATANCNASGQCVIATCNANRANCDMMSGNGCESMATMNNNCCGTDCTGMAGMTNCHDNGGANGRATCGP